MKRWLSLILLLSMLLSLGGCGKGARPGVPSEEPGAEESGGHSPEQADPAPDDGEEKITGEDGSREPAVSEPAYPLPLQVMIGSRYQSETDPEDMFILLCSVEWNTLGLGEESAASFPELERALRELNGENEEIYHEILKQMLPDAAAAAGEWEYFSGFTSNSDLYVQRADDRLFSVRADEDEYTGGVHPNYWTYGINIDPATGEKVELTQVLTDTRELPAILTEKLKEKYQLEEFYSLSEQLEEYEPQHFSWTMDYQGITFYFSPYEIASYAAGLLTATIWFEELPELFQPRYTVAPEFGWAKELPVYNEVEADLDPQDGEKDRLTVSTVEEEYGNLQLYVYRDDEVFVLEEFYGYEAKPMLVCHGMPGQERFFLYVEGVAENDYSNLYVYDLNGDGVTLNGHLYGAGLPGMWRDDEGEFGTWYESVLTDPSAPVLDSIIHSLGTRVGYRTYSADPMDGTLHPIEQYYEVSGSEPPIRSSVDLEVTILPGEEREIVPAGSEFLLRRIEPDSYAELELEDGRMCRIDFGYDEERWEPLINGIPEWECFEDLVYAG